MPDPHASMTPWTRGYPMRAFVQFVHPLRARRGLRLVYTLGCPFAEWELPLQHSDLGNFGKRSEIAHDMHR
jgi:hypothetical protein